MKHRVNTKAVVILFAGLAVLAVGVHFLHGYQVKRNARGVYEQALLMEQEGQLAQAADYFEQYLGLSPGDNEALTRLGVLLDQLAKTPRARGRAFYMLEQVVRRDASRKDIRRRVIRMATMLGRYTDAEHHLKILLTESPEDAELLQMMGRCAAGELKYDDADEWYRKALKLAPTRIDLAVEYAALLRNRLDMPTHADVRIELMVRANEQSPEARREGIRYFYRHARWDQAEKHVRFAMEKLGLEDADVLLLAAAVARARGKPAEARKHLERGRQLYPGEERLARALAQLDLRDGDRKRALRYLEDSLKNLPTDTQQLWLLAGLFLEADDLERTAILSKRLGHAGAMVPMQCLQAKVLMQREAWAEARQILVKAPLVQLRAGEPWARPLAAQVPFLLAICYDRLANPDQRLHAFEQAVKAAPDWPAARRGLAWSLLALGKNDQGLAELRTAAKRAPQLGSELAQLLIARNERRPAAEQQWQEVETLLAGLTPAGEPAVEIEAMRARVLAAQGKLDEARKRMEAARDRDPKQVLPWLSLASLARQQGKEEAALALLDKAEEQAGRRIEWYLARASVWARARSKDTPDRLRDLEKHLEEFKGGERNRLLTALADGFDVAGDSAKAETLWRRLAEARPHDLAVRVRLLERAMRPGKEDEARALTAEIRQIEGDHGPLTAFAEAVQLIVHTRGDNAKRLTTARSLLARAGEQRPSWTWVPVLEAQAYEQEERTEQALEKYQAALERGEGRLFVVRRVLQLLYQQRRYAEAQALVRKLPEQALGVGDLGRIAAALALTDAGDSRDAGREQALRLARKGALDHPQDYRDQHWLGQVAAAADRLEEAETAFRRARDLAETEPVTWAALILFLAPRDAAKAEAELAKAQTKLTTEQLGPLRAAAYEALGKLAQAEEQTFALAGKHPSPTGMVRTAGFYLRTGQPAKAEPWLRTLITTRPAAPESAVVWARRELALLLAYRGAYSSFKEALALLDANAARGAPRLEDQRVRAAILSTQPAHRREAIALLEKLPIQDTAGSPISQFMLAQLYEVDGNWTRARALMTGLLKEHGKDPAFIARFVRSLLQHQETDAAEAWLAKLTEVAPRSFETIALHTRVLKARGNTREAVERVKEYARAKDARLDLAGRLLDELGQPDEAEALYRSLAAKSDKSLAVLLLAQHLAARRLEEALALCERAWQTCPPDAVAAACLTILRAGNADAPQRERVARWLAAALAKDAKSAGVAIAYAELQMMSGRHAEAAKLYRGVLAQNPKHVVALNNLAYLLAMTEGKPAEALVLADRSVESAGPQAELLDTRALVYLKAGKADAALRDLEHALAQVPAPMLYFHLAQAHALANDRPAASEALRKATALGFQEGMVSALEQPALRQLVAALKESK